MTETTTQKKIRKAFWRSLRKKIWELILKFVQKKVEANK